MFGQTAASRHGVGDKPLITTICMLARFGLRLRDSISNAVHTPGIVQVRDRQIGLHAGHVHHGLQRR
jgi:hypothetical protein